MFIDTRFEFLLLLSLTKNNKKILSLHFLTLQFLTRKKRKMFYKKVLKIFSVKE